MESKLPQAPFTMDIKKIHDELVCSAPPSHISQDGHFIFLPQPTQRNRIQFFERSIARFGLLKGYLNDSEEAQEEKPDEQKRVHPLAGASASLQSNGVNELNRAINLNTLVASDEYFGLSNIVDPSLDQTAAGERTITSSARPEAKRPAEAAPQLEASQRYKASLIWKSKMQQFHDSSKTFQRHKRQLIDAIVAQQQPDRRLRQLRSQWRLVAPEHGSRALPHAARATEVLAADVDVHGTTSAALGRLTKRIPRFATVELHESFPLEEHVHKLAKIAELDIEEGGSTEEMMDESSGATLGDPKISTNEIPWTRAKAFAIVDPTLGKIDADFDPQKVALLTVRVEIEKASTGFCQSAHLEPMRTMSMLETGSHSGQDEKVLIDLQHSLFCAKLFESIRREVLPDTIELGQAQALSKQNSVWLSCQADELFLTPPSIMSGAEGSKYDRLSVVHCHEGEVKVHLDSEYTLCVKLVEARDSNSMQLSSISSAGSGSQTGDQLKLLCRTLLHHAQEAYHLHSVSSAAKKRKEEYEEKMSGDPLLRKKNISVESPSILQSTVALGGKVLFEHRIRKTLLKVNQHIKMKCGSGLGIEWLPLSLFDLTAHFVVFYGDLVFDANIVGNELTATQLTDEYYRKTKFYSDTEFELFLLKVTARHNEVLETE
ncbi:hypothetical protein FisN_38Lh025 [Fistulifera solaris]|uniref:Uncharacterized protein n=1 Tax=Fistulifera solaris TaxID=1519565 RepID=A0A1Z5J6H2_FISSO|nr:hypothetical protein FisN_38Lh025 [Fistulifera solaris]|eukprot:GAX09604.1 hypothetical protein FisN_38Lh025 [Fistulifera solaris]